MDLAWILIFLIYQNHYYNIFQLNYGYLTIPPKHKNKTNSWFHIKDKINNTNESNDIYQNLYHKLKEIQYEDHAKLFFEEMIDNELQEAESIKSNASKTDYLDKNKGVKYDPSKKPCQFIVTRKYKEATYGRSCNEQCDGDNNVCSNHNNKKELKYDFMAEKINLCQHIITQRSRNSDRKGMICGNFTFNSKNTKYCNDHIHRHNEEAIKLNEDEALELRTSKIRFYPNKHQEKQLNIYFGGSRKTYNLCIEYEIHAEDKLNEDELKKAIVTNIEEKSNEHIYLKKIPKEIRAFAVKEYVTGRNNSEKAYNDRLMRNQEAKEPEIEYKKRRQVKVLQ